MFQTSYVGKRILGLSNHKNTKNNNAKKLLKARKEMRKTITIWQQQRASSNLQFHDVPKPENRINFAVKLPSLIGVLFGALSLNIKTKRSSKVPRPQVKFLGLDISPWSFVLGTTQGGWLHQICTKTYPVAPCG